MPDVTFCDPDLDSFCGLDRLGLTVTGQQVGDDHTVLSCRVVEPDQWCRRCGVVGQWHDTVARDLAHVPLGWRPTILRLRVRRWRCTGCGGVWRQDTGLAAVPRGKLSRPAVLWALKCLVIDWLSISRIAAMLAVSWHTVNDAVLAPAGPCSSTTRTASTGSGSLGSMSMPGDTPAGVTATSP